MTPNDGALYGFSTGRVVFPAALFDPSFSSSTCGFLRRPTTAANSLRI